MKLHFDAFNRIFSDWEHLFSERKDFLIEMDSHLGDGDLGITMAKIFSAAAEQVRQSQNLTVGKLIMTAGMAMAKTAPSTMGTLMGSAFMEAGKPFKETDSFDVSDWEPFFDGLQKGIAKRGKTSVGEKTIYDVLYPVYEFVRDSSAATHTELFELLIPYARTCLEKTADMEAQHGKAACFGEKSKGRVDAGAMVAFLLIESLGKSLSTV